MTDDDYLAQIQHFMEVGIPFNRFLGLKAVEVSKGFVALRLPFREEFVGDPSRPALHGGTISMLVDTAGGAAVFTAADPGDTCSTIDLRIDYLRRGELTDLLAEATVLRLGNRVGVSRIRVFQDALDDPGAERRLVAEATGVYNLRRRSDATGQFPLERR